MGAVGRRSTNLAGMGTILGLAAANVGHSCWGPLLGVCDDDDDQRRCRPRHRLEGFDEMAIANARRAVGC